MPTTPSRRALREAGVHRELAAATGLPREQIEAVFTAVLRLARRELGKKGPGVFNLVGLLRLRTHRKPQQPARTMINPFTGVLMKLPPRPARVRVRARALKRLKDLVN